MNISNARIRNGLMATVVLMLVSPASWGLTTYSENFDGLNMADTNALGNAGWLVYGNVWDGAAYTSNYLYGYGPFGAPNGGSGTSEGFSALVPDQGGPEQGTQQLSVYNDYHNFDHANGYAIEANVYQEQSIGAGDVGETWSFSFDAKLGNIEGASTAAAFIKTLDPQAGFALTNFLTADMTSTSTLWTTYKLSIFIDASLVGQLLQFGFLSVATNYEGSGIFYDNVAFGDVVPIPGAVLLLASGLAGLMGFRRKPASA